MTLLLWSLVFLRTLVELRNGQIFESPCIEEIDMARKSTKQMSEAPSMSQNQDVYSQPDTPNGSMSPNGSATAHAWSTGGTSSTTASIRPSQSL